MDDWYLVGRLGTDGVLTSVLASYVTCNLAFSWYAQQRNYPVK